MLASRIISQARVLLKDPAGIRWADPELLGWLNGGQLQIVAVRPDAKATKADLELAAGTEQAIPEGGTRLLDVIRNLEGRAITLASRDQLNEFDPDWYTADPGEFIKHYTFDQNDPKTFEVYPPAEAGMKVRILYAAIPEDCDAVTEEIDLDPIYEGPLIDWTCYRALSKNSDSTEDANRAAGFLATFMQALTGKSQTDATVKPGRK